MKISDFFIIHLFTMLFLFNLGQSFLGFWSIIIYALVIILTYYSIRILADQSSEHPNEIPNLWRFKIENVCSSWLEEESIEDEIDEMAVCLECHEQNCDRHDPELNVYQQPWRYLKIDVHVNAKIEELFEFLLDKYTSSWIQNISYDKKLLLSKFKELIRLMIASLLLRMKKRMNLNDFILKQMPIHLLQHLEMYVHGKRKARSAHFVEESVLKQYENLIHPAVLNADNELKYFKSIADLIISTSVASKHLKCDVTRSFLNEFVSCCVLSPLVEILTDPDKINIFLIYLLDPNSDVDQYSPTVGSSSEKVYFLQGFSANHEKIHCSQKNPFGIKLKQILTDEHLLFLFTRFATEENFLNYLQFVIHMDGFLNRIINPDLDQEKLKKLHDSLKNIYNLYFNTASKDFINFDISIREGFQKVIQGNYANVEQFRNSKFLYESYEYVNEILDYYAQKFFHTDAYLQMICGQRSSTISNHDSMDSDHRSTSSNMETSLSTSIDFQCSRQNNKIEINGCDNDLVDESSSCDMTNWTVSIPFVSTKMDNEANRENFYFEIHVLKTSDEGLMVERQFNEFYILESKLKEFHGDELDDICLPTRKPFVRITKQLLDNHRMEFEGFLQQLLSNQSMKRSKLFYNFLNSSTDCFTGNFNLTKIIRNVPSRFSKEKGQHLYSFLKNFIMSSEKDTASLNGNESPSSTNEGPIEGRKKRRKSTIRWPEFSFDSDFSVCETGQTQFKYLYDYILILLIRFYKLNDRIAHLFYFLRPLLRQTFEGFCDYLLRKKIKQKFTPERIANMVEYLKNSVDQESDKVNNFPMNMTKNQRSELALKLLKEILPKCLLNTIVDYDKHEETVFLVFSLLQYRLLNKQLLYLVLDLLITELFPKILLDTIDQNHQQHLDFVS